MNYIGAKHLDAVGKHLVDSAPDGITIATLAKLLRVSLPTAKRRLTAYAASRGLSLQSRPVREGARGKASAEWFLSAAKRPQPVSAPRPSAVVDEREDAALGLSASLMSALTADERLALRVLAKAGTARTGDLAARVGRAPDRMEGLMRVLRRKLSKLGSPMIDDDTLPDGEALFRYTGKKAP